MARHQIAFVLAATAALTGAAHAQDLVSVDFLRGAYAKVGLLASHEADEGTLTIAAVPVPGADFITNTTYGATLEAGLRLGDSFGISVFGTTPLTTPNTASGTLAGLGNLGDGTVGYYALTGHVHAALGDLFMPYVGGGIGYMHVFGTRDGVISGLTIKPAVGAVLQAGVDIPIDEHFGVFLDAKQFFISTDVTGTVGGLPVYARTRVDPWVISAGISATY